LPYELDFLRAGNSNGDAVIVRWAPTKDAPFYINIVDGGFTDTGDQIIDHVERYYAKPAIVANIVLTHADNDHACALIKVLEHFDVRTLWMNKPWDYVDEVLDQFHGAYTRDGLVRKMREMHPYQVDLENIAARKNIPIRAPLQGRTSGSSRFWRRPAHDTFASSRTSIKRRSHMLRKPPELWVQFLATH
jgi:hypothetical protein